MAKHVDVNDVMNTFNIGKSETSYPNRGSETPKRQVGRPKSKDVKNTCRNINIAVPITLLDRYEEIKIATGNNQTAYIIGLIEKDLDENYDRYKAILEMMKK